METLQEISALFGIVLLVGQYFCFYSKNVWIRLIPLLVIAALAVVCVVIYAINPSVNWGYLIFLPFLFDRAVILGVVWLIYGIAYMIKKLQNN